MNKRFLLLSLLSLFTLVSCGGRGSPSSSPASSSGSEQDIPWSDGAYQTLRIQSRPEKTLYRIGEKLDLTGLSVTLLTTYYEDGERHQDRRTLSEGDYALEIDGKPLDVATYAIGGVGRHIVEVTFEGRGGPASANFSIESEMGEIEKPEKILDETVSWKTDEDVMEVRFKNPARTSSTPSVAALDQGNPHPGYLDPSQLEIPYYAKDFGLHNYDGWRYSPSVNTPDNPTTNFLVVPIVAPGKSSLATPELWNTIDKAFFGKSDELRFESLRSYYAKSSFGQLDIAGRVTDYFYPERETSDYNTDAKISAASSDPDGRVKFFQAVLDWIERKYAGGVNLDDYDQDRDGVIDGIWFVYVYDKTSTNPASHWAYSSSTQQKPAGSAPVINNYGWITSAFLNPVGTSDEAGDAHVVIHESGHMFGLKDYYTTDGSSHAATGKTDMMERNVGDHNPYSKMYMGWVKPYVVYGDDVTISIPSSQAEDALIVLPYDSKTYEKNPETGKISFNLFDEYLVLDYYTPENMNAFDYPSYSAHPLPVAGGRLYHVDNRLGVIQGRNEAAGTYVSQMIPDEGVDQAIRSYFTDPAKDGKVQKVISNTPDIESKYYGLFETDAGSWDEIRLIDAAKRKENPSQGFVADAQTLFYSGKDPANAFKTFSLSDYADQFVAQAFDNEEAFSYSFEILGFPKAS